MTKAFIGLGSNLGDGPTIVTRAWQTIGEEEGITTVAISHPYVSAPVGMNSQHWFTNCAGELETALTAHQLLNILLRIEAAFGRIREGRITGYQDRILDLDILFFGTLSINEPELIIPHPRLAERLFVLSPLAEIGPDWTGGGSETIKEMELNLLHRMQNKEIPLQKIIRQEW